MAQFSPPQIVGDAPDHPVLAKPWEYSIRGVRLSRREDTSLNDSLELDLRREDEEVRLQFEGVQGLEIDSGFLDSYMALQILDISKYQWDGIKIRVAGFEQGPGIRFYARTVNRHTDS